MRKKIWLLIACLLVLVSLLMFRMRPKSLRNDFDQLLILARESPPTRIGSQEGWMTDNGYLYYSDSMYVMCIYMSDLDHYLLISRVKGQILIVEILHGPGPENVKKLQGLMAKKYLTEMGLDWTALDHLLSS